jgi:hypothetical protein
MKQTLLYEIAGFFNEVFGYWPSILVPFIFVAVLLTWQIRKMSFNLTIFVALFSIFPALTPAVTQILGYDYFTMLNYDLQQDLTLNTAAVMLISLFTAFIIFGAMLPNHIRHLEHRERHILGTLPLGIMLVVLFLFAFFFLESGSVLHQGYGDIKFDAQAPFSSLVNQFINACVAAFLCYLGSQSRQRLALTFYIVMIILSLLLARRTLALSLIILVTYSFGTTTLNFKKILFLCLAGMLLIFIGEARSVGIVNYLQGMRSAGSLEFFFSLPGGASNIFVGSMGVIHMLGRDVLSFPETTPILLWPVGIYESSIYGSLNYDYNGGMHIANTLYWNFGILGVCLGALFLGWVTTRVHVIVSRVSKDLGGTYPAMLGFVYILMFPNLIWYNPIGLLKLALAVTFGFVTLTIIKRATRPFSSGGSLIGKSRAHR